MPARHPLAAATPLLVVLLATAEAAAGQRIPSPYRFYETRQEVSVFGGWVDPGTGQFGYGPGPGPMLGARYSVDLSEPLSVEAVLDWVPTTRDVMDPRRQEGNRKIGTAKDYLVTLDARFKLSLTGARTWHHLNPFVSAGAGAAWDLAPTALDEVDLIQTDRFDFKTSFLGNLGGGVRWFFNDHWVVRGEGTLQIWKLKTPSGFTLVERGFGNVGSAEWVNAKSATIGLSWRY